MALPSRMQSERPDSNRAPRKAPPAPNLLDPRPWTRIDAASTETSLVFSFTGGEIGDVLERTLEVMPLSPSSWDGESFARDVFLAEFVDRCMPVIAEGRSMPRSARLLQRILTAPPADRAVPAFRHEVFRELIQSQDFRRGLEHFYRCTLHLRDLFSKNGIIRIDSVERQLGILRTIRDIVEDACTAFIDTKSGLKTIHRWAAAAKESAGYQRLCSLLEYEEGSKELDVRLQLGFDGHIRAFRVLDRRPNTQNSFYESQGRRVLRKISLFMRGERFTDQELLSQLLCDVFEDVVVLLPSLFPVLGDVEFYLAGMSFRDGAIRAGLNVTLPTFTTDGSRDGRQLDELFNPLLASEGKKPVPCTIRTDHADALVIVTGPNSGGKTRLLQSLALTQILAQAGLFVPARSAVLPWASGLFVSLLEHASPDQEEGRLGTELLRIRRLFESLEAGYLVILDELCSGTNPSEGEDIFRLVVKLLGELSPAAFITTHFLEFAARLSVESTHLAFLQVALDAEERPTYAFKPGVASTSLAHRTAARLGVTEDALRDVLAMKKPPSCPAQTPMQELDACGSSEQPVAQPS